MTDILFLDFDGVVHPLFPRTDRTYEENQHFEGCSRLANVLDRVAPKVKIVISSTWRAGYTIDQIRAFLGPLGGRVIGMSPILNLREDGARELEAQLWLDEYTRNHSRPMIRWFALDDIIGIWTSHEKVLVCNDGFRTAEIKELEENIENLLNAPETAPIEQVADRRIWLPTELNIVEE